MPLPIEQRKDIFEISSDLNLMQSYRKAIMEKMSRMWVLIHFNKNTKNYGLEVTNSWGNQCSQDETEKVKEIIRICRGESIIESSSKKPKRRKKDQEVGEA